MNKIQYTTLREKPCGYNHSMIKRLRMLETTKGFISASDNKIDVYMYHDTLKIIDVNPSSLSFTDSFNGDTYEQTLSFEIPLINYQFYFHYNILEYINNRYYCIIETTDGKYIVGGYKSGMFPSYAIEENNIIITLKTNTISNNTLISDYISFNEIDYNHCVGIDGECIDGLWTYKLIQRLELDGSVSDEYYALNGYENYYTDINIVGTYSRFDTVFGIKLTNPLYDCFKQCYISGLPSFINFKKTGETQCYVIDSDCDFTYTYDITIIDVTFNEDTNELCVTPLKMDSSTQIKITTSDGIDRFINIVIGTVGGEEGEYDKIYRWYYNGETLCLDENQSINCISSVTIPNETITSGVCTYYKTEEYISPLCDGEYYFYDYGVGDLISCERIYRWVISDNESDYYCDYKSYTKYAMEYEEYSDDNGLTWIRTNNSRITDIVLEEYSEDCGYGADCGNDLLLFIDRNYDGKGTVRINLNDYNVPINNYSGLTTLTDLGVDIFTNANSMFKRDSTIRRIISIPCTDYVTDMYNMFEGLYDLYRIECITDLKTYNVTDMSYMFENCSSLTSLDLSSFDTSKVTNMYAMFSGCTNLTSLDLSSFDTSNVTSMRYMFENCHKLTSLDISNWDTSKITDIDRMFKNCHRLTSLDLSNWDISNVIYMGSVFYGCESLTSLDLSNWDMSNITSLDNYPNGVYFFEDCSADVNFNNVKFNNVSASIFKNSGLRKIDLTNADFTLVSSTTRIFENCGATEIILNTNLSTNDIETMFSHCINLKEVTFGTNFKTNNITSTFALFSGCISLKSFDAENLNTSNVTNMTQMFEDCSGLTSLDLSPLDVSNVTNMYNMFENCSSLTSLDLSNWDLTNLILDESTFMFTGCKNLRSIIMNNCNCTTISKIKNQLSVSLLLNQVTIYSNNTLCDGVVNGLPSTSGGTESSGNVDTIAFTFTWDITEYIPIIFTINGKKYEVYERGHYSNTLSGLGITEFTNADYMFSNQKNITAITSIPDTSNVTNMSSMFRYCSGLTSLDVTKTFNTSNVTNMYEMFNNCYNLTSLDVSSFDTSNVTNMYAMFSGCKSLTSLNVSNFNTSNVTNMYHMFNSCSGLTSLDLSSFDTSNVTDMDYMFAGCQSLTSLDLSSFDTSNVTNMKGMFSGCRKLGYTSCLDLSNFDTSKVTDMSNMFNWCTGLISINLNNWDTSMVTNMSGMFSNCESLTSLDLSSFDVSNVTNMDSMFYFCKSLIYLDLSNWDLSSINYLPYSMFDYSTNIAEIKVENCSNETIEKIMDLLSIKGAKYENNIIYL